MASRCLLQFWPRYVDPNGRAVTEAYFVPLRELKALSRHNFTVHVAAILRVFVENPDSVVLPMNAAVETGQTSVIESYVRFFASANNDMLANQ
jgi:hypothetical protein